MADDRRFGGRLLGAHTSITGGVEKAFKRAEDDGFTAMQIFLKNQQQWKVKPYDQTTVDAYRENAKASPVRSVIAHASYLINLASPKDELWEKSIYALADEVHRANLLGVEGVVFHPGSHTGSGDEAGIERIAKALDRVYEIADDMADGGAMVLLENTAGQGTSIGWQFEQHRDILGKVRDPSRYGICLDTCHMTAAGYDIRTAEAYDATMSEFDKLLGIDRIKAWHLNDSKQPFASRKDRHEHIGDGHVGIEAFRALMNDERFIGVPMCLETDPETDMHPENLRRLVELIEN